MNVGDIACTCTNLEAEGLHPVRIEAERLNTLVERLRAEFLAYDCEHKHLQRHFQRIHTSYLLESSRDMRCLFEREMRAVERAAESIFSVMHSLRANITEIESSLAEIRGIKPCISISDKALPQNKSPYEVIGGEITGERLTLLVRSTLHSATAYDLYLHSGDYLEKRPLFELRTKEAAAPLSEELVSVLHFHIPRLADQSIAIWKGNTTAASGWLFVR